MSPIRVHLGPMPEMLRTFIKDLLSVDGGIVVVGHSDEQNQVFRHAREQGADMLIAQVGGSADHSSIDTVLSAAPVKIFAIRPDGKNAEVVNLTRQAIALDGDRQAVLGEAIRQAAHNFDTSSERSARWPGWEQ
jgi:DNA-binding NarL/FixJ family response regulator